MCRHNHAIYRQATDGGAALHVVGERGTAANVHAMRHYVQWKHPKLYVSDVNGADSGCLFQDDNVSVFPITR